MIDKNIIDSWKVRLNALNNVETFSSSQHVKVKKIHQHLGSEKQIDIASRLKESRWMNLIRKNKYLFNKCKTYYEKRTHMSYIKNLNQIPVDDDSIFIESFHGKNFSGDPKYIALAIKRYGNQTLRFYTCSIWKREIY